jgi:hypothetical protein
MKTAPPANFLRARKASLMVEAMFGGPATSGCGTCNYVPDSETNADGLIDPIYRARENSANHRKVIRSAGSGRSYEMIRVYLITFQIYQIIDCKRVMDTESLTHSLRVGRRKSSLAILLKPALRGA